MTAQFLGYQHWNKYRNDHNMIGATSEVDHDFKRLDTLERELDNIYDEDGLIVPRCDIQDIGDAKRFSIMLGHLKAEAEVWVEKNGEISSQWLAYNGARSAVYETADDYVKDVERKIDRLVERDDGQWEWDCFVDGLQYLLDELIEGAVQRNPGMTGRKYIKVAARNIDWRGRSGALFCEPDAKILLQKITGNHNSPSYHFYWGEQVGVVDDYGSVAMFSEKKFLHMVMPHHDAVTHADIEVVWDGTDANSNMDAGVDDMIDESELPEARKACAMMHEISHRIYGEDRYDRMFGERKPRPRIYNIIGFSSRSFVDVESQVLSENALAEVMDSIMGDLWFWVKQNYEESAATYMLASDYYHTAVAHYACHVQIFRDLTFKVIDAIEQDDIAQESGDE